MNSRDIRWSLIIRYVSLNLLWGFWIAAVFWPSSVNQCAVESWRRTPARLPVWVGKWTGRNSSVVNSFSLRGCEIRRNARNQTPPLIAKWVEMFNVDLNTDRDRRTKHNKLQIKVSISKSLGVTTSNLPLFNPGWRRNQQTLIEDLRDLLVMHGCSRSLSEEEPWAGFWLRWRAGEGESKSGSRETLWRNWSKALQQHVGPNDPGCSAETREEGGRVKIVYFRSHLHFCKELSLFAACATAQVQCWALQSCWHSGRIWNCRSCDACWHKERDYEFETDTNLLVWS